MMSLFTPLNGPKREQALDSFAFNWSGLMKDIETPYYGWKDRPVGKIKYKIPMHQLIITDEYAVWAFRVIEGKVKYSFQYWLTTEV